MNYSLYTAKGKSALGAFVCQGHLAHLPSHPRRASTCLLISILSATFFSPSQKLRPCNENVTEL